MDRWRFSNRSILAHCGSVERTGNDRYRYSLFYFLLEYFHARGSLGRVRCFHGAGFCLQVCGPGGWGQRPNDGGGDDGDDPRVLYRIGNSETTGGRPYLGRG